jgi:hypothetical protein
MPLPPAHMKERLSVSYVTAVAARAGVGCRLSDPPEYGTDAYLVRVKKLRSGKYCDTGHIISCQIKATTTSKRVDDNVVYDMEVDDYNKLAEWEGGVCILILFCLPEDPEEWLKLSEDELVLQKCCYWKQITDPPSQNKSKQRVYIPRSQVFTPQTIVALLEKVRWESGSNG